MANRSSFMELFLSETWVRDNYWVSDTTGDRTLTASSYGPCGPYSVMIASRIPIRMVSVTPFPKTTMGRCLLVAHLNFPADQEQMSVGSVHLESMENAAEWRSQ